MTAAGLMGFASDETMIVVVLFVCLFVCLFEFFLD
jgi:hypothetical protein